MPTVKRNRYDPPFTFGRNVPENIVRPEDRYSSKIVNDFMA